MKRLRLSIQVVVALLALAATMAARGNVFKHTVLRTTQDCYINPSYPTPGTCVSPSLLTNTDNCTEPRNVYCCYTFLVCPTSSTKVQVYEIILYRGD